MASQNRRNFFVFSNNPKLNCLRGRIQLSKKSPPRKLSLFIDEDGLLRIGGHHTNVDLPRDKRHPVILPKTHHITTLIVRHYHEDIYHQGRRLTEGAVRSAGVWIVGGKRLVSSVLHNSVTCKTERDVNGTENGTVTS